MAKKKDDDEELMPTPEQAQAYAERALACIALARLDKFCAALPASQLAAHPVHAGCIAISALGHSMLIVEYPDQDSKDGTSIGVGVPPMHANWIENFPFSCIAITDTEVFFVTKGFVWLGSEIPSMGISLGPLIPGNLLARFCRQKTVQFFITEGPLTEVRGGTTLRDDRPVPLYSVPDGINVLATREHYEIMERKSKTDDQSLLQSHFLG